jgi:hypothetical protein
MNQEDKDKGWELRKKILIDARDCGLPSIDAATIIFSTGLEIFLWSKVTPNSIRDSLEVFIKHWKENEGKSIGN